MEPALILFGFIINYNLSMCIKLELKLCKLWDMQVHVSWEAEKCQRNISFKTRQHVHLWQSWRLR